MAPIISDQPLPRRSASGMASRAVNAAAGVLLAAMEQGRHIPTSLAIDLDSACLLNSPETAAELAQLRADVPALRARVAELEQQLAGKDRPVDEDPIAFALTEKAEQLNAAAPPRAAQLLEAIRTRRGEWTTRKAQKVYRSLGNTEPLRAAARTDLRILHAMGHLVQHEANGRRFYTLRTRTGGGQ